MVETMWRDPLLSFSIAGIEPGCYWCCWFGLSFVGKKKESLEIWQPWMKMKLLGGQGRQHPHYLRAGLRLGLGFYFGQQPCCGSVAVAVAAVAAVASEAERPAVAAGIEHVNDGRIEKMQQRVIWLTDYLNPGLCSWKSYQSLKSQGWLEMNHRKHLGQDLALKTQWTARTSRSTPNCPFGLHLHLKRTHDHLLPG